MAAVEDRRPAFARDFPRTPALDALVDAFARGDYARVRAEGRKLVAAEDEGVRRAAQTLLARTGADPLAIWLLVIAAALLVIVSAYWVVQEHLSGPERIHRETGRRGEDPGSCSDCRPKPRARSTRAAT